MKCYKCGAEVSQENAFCGKCGNPIRSIASLVEEGRKGDQQALGELYSRTYEKVYFTLKGLCRDEDTVLDLLQDSYLKAYKNLDNLKEPGSFQAWIKRIAVNTAKNWFIKKKPTLFSQVTDDEDEEFNPVDAIVDEYPDHQPEDVMDRKETSRLLKEIVDSLSDEQRIVISLFYKEEWDVKSIAKHIGCPENTIKSRLSYGRKKIEEAVLALEKKGTKLYGLAPIPFFLWLLRGQEAQAAPAAGIIGNVLADLGKDAAAEIAGSAATQTGAHGAAQTAANTGSHGAAQTAANTAAHATATAAAKSGAAAVTKGLAAKLVAVVIGGAVIGGGFTVGTLTYAEKTEELKQRQAEEAIALKEQSEEEKTPTEEKPSEPGDGVDMIETTPEPTPEATPEATPEPEQEPAAGNADSHEVYEPILAELRDFVNNGIEKIEWDSIWRSIPYEKNRELHEKYPNVNFEFFSNEQDYKDEMYYAYYDIDQNGQDELIIGIADSQWSDELILGFEENVNSISRMDIYACNGNVPRDVLEGYYTVRPYENVQKIYTDGTIAGWYFQHAGINKVVLGKLAEDGFTFRQTEMINVTNGTGVDPENTLDEFKANLSAHTEVEFDWHKLLSAESETEVTQPETPQQEPAENPDSENKAARKAYKKVLKEIRLFLGSDVRNSEWRMNTDVLAEKYPHVNFSVLADGNCSPADYDLYYYCYDIDHNGVDELLLSYCQGDGAMDIYTFDGEIAKSIQNQESGPAFAYRYNNKIFTDGTIYEYGSGGASAGWAYFYKLADDGYSIMETKNTAVYSPDYAAQYGYTDYITQDELEGMLSQYEEVTNLKWKKLKPIPEDTGDNADANTTPVDVTTEYQEEVVALMTPFDWYLAWQGSDFVFDDYTRSCMVCQAVNGMGGMSYEEVKAACQEPMKRYFGPDAKFVLKEAAEYTEGSTLYMYQIIGGKLRYMYGNQLCNLIGVADNIQKIGSDTYQVKYDYYYAPHQDDIDMGYADPNFREYMISYNITLKDTDSGFIISEMTLL